MKKHWFGLIISIVVLAYIILFALVLGSPTHDLQKRGFIKCTENFVDTSKSCKGRWCLIKAVAENSLCDFEIVGEGLVNWVKGEQETPWSNYIFEPEVEQQEEGIQEFYDENPNLIYDIKQLKKLNKELESGE